jgi:hypothetical protein
MSRGDTTLSPFPRAPRVSWRAIGPQHCFQIRRAVQNVANSASTTMATVLITGDSTGLESGNDSLNVYDTAFGLITRKIQAENPGVSFRFINRAIGGNTWGNLNAAGTGNLPSWYHTPAANWINAYIAPAQNHGKNMAPDLVVILMGTNDNRNMGLVSPAGVLAKFADTAANWFPTTPDIWLVTSMGRTRDPSFSTPEQIHGAVLAPSTTRLIAQGGHALLTNAAPVFPRPLGLLDFGRMWGMTTLGFDPVQQHFDALSTAELAPFQNMTAPGTTGFELPHCDGDFDATVLFPEQAATLLAGRAMRIGIGAPLAQGAVRSIFLCQVTSTNMVTFYQPGLGTVQFAGATRALGSGHVTLRIMARGNDAFLSLNGQTVWDGQVIRGHAPFAPRIWFGADGADNLVCSLTAFRSGRRLAYANTLNDLMAWGENPVGIQGRTGGNRINHPSSLYMREVIGPVLENESFYFGALS